MACSAEYCVKRRRDTSKGPSTRERKTKITCLIIILLHTNIINGSTTLIKIDTITVSTGKNVWRVVPAKIRRGVCKKKQFRSSTFSIFLFFSFLPWNLSRIATDKAV